MLGLEVHGFSDVDVSGLNVVARNRFSWGDHHRSDEDRGYRKDTDGEHVVC